MVRFSVVTAFVAFILLSFSLSGALTTPAYAQGASKATMDLVPFFGPGAIDPTKSFAIARCDDKGTLKVNGHLHKTDQAGTPLSLFVNVDGTFFILLGTFTPNVQGNVNFQGSVGPGLASGGHDVVVAMVNPSVTVVYADIGNVGFPPLMPGIPFSCP